MKKVWDTLSKNDLYSWISHAVVAALLSFLFSPAAAIGYYTFREAEQVFMDKFVYKTPLKPLDHVMDVVAPAAAVGIFHLWG